MLGAGSSPLARRITWPGAESVDEWTTLDCFATHRPDILFDLNNIAADGDQIPVEDEYFDEIHAYEILEHIGRQGDYKDFFFEFKEYWRILKPEGYLVGTSPALHSRWLWGDPGHTRAITGECLSFLTKEHYEANQNTVSSDYTSLVAPCWWKLVHSNIRGETYEFGLQK